MLQMVKSKIVMLRPDEIKSCGLGPRRFFHDSELFSLSESIRQNGIIQPLIVRKSRAGGYELIAGERRLRAAITVGLRRIPCVVCFADSCQGALYALNENLHRSNLNFFEQAQAIVQIINDFGIERSRLAVQLGMTETALREKLYLLKIDKKHREKIINAGLTENHAKALLLLDEQLRGKAIDYIILNELSASAAEEYIERLINPPKIKENPPERKPIRKMAVCDIKIFANSINKLVGAMVDSGIAATSRRKENDKYIEYTIKINKSSLNSEDSVCQLRIC